MSRTAITASLLFHIGAAAVGPKPSCEEPTLTSSHGQAMRDTPLLVLTRMSTVPTSVTVATCRPSRTLSPTQNCILLPSRPSECCPRARVGRTGRSRPLPSVIESGDGDFMARVPAEGVSAVAPIHLVPNRVRVNDDAGAVSTSRPRQHGVADHRSTRIAPDNHDQFPGRRLTSATNLCPRLSITSQEYGPRNCVTPNLWTTRRASASQRISAVRRPSLVVTIHISAPTNGP